MPLQPRRYDLAGDVLACAVEESQHAGGPVAQALAGAAWRAGRQLAAPGSSLAEVLTRAGYEPKQAADGEIRLANCPFHELVRRHPALVCELNLHLLSGLLAELGSASEARLAPTPGHCCVTISPSDRPATDSQPR